MLIPNRHGNSPAYRYGFNGKEKDDEVKGEGLQYDYGFRIYDPRIGKFLSQDPLVANFPWWSPYHFAGNSPICASDLDGLEIFFEVVPPQMISPVIGTLRPSTLLPRIAIEIEPIPGGQIILPPHSILPSELTVGQPRIDAIKEIDWDSAPPSPDDLGKNWEDISDPRNPNGRKFKNRDNPEEEITFDKGVDGERGWKGIDHWHRKNPNSKNRHDYYLDKFGNPVGKGSEASHIEASKMMLIPEVDIIRTFEKKNAFDRFLQGVKDFFTPDPEPKKSDKQKLEDGTLYS